MVLPLDVILRAATVAPVPPPASRPILNGALVVQLTVSVVVPGTAVVRVPTLAPKLSVGTLTIVQVFTSVICTVKVVVAVAANASSAVGRRQAAAITPVRTTRGLRALGV